MKRLMNIFLAIVFFNLSVFTFYYLGIIKSYSLTILDNNFDILITNVVFLILICTYSFIYEKFLIDRFNYLKIMVLGLLLGIIISLFMPRLIFQEYLYIVLFTSFIVTFVSYNIYFDKVKDKVFK